MYYASIEIGCWCTIKQMTHPPIWDIQQWPFLNWSLGQSNIFRGLWLIHQSCWLDKTIRDGCPNWKVMTLAAVQLVLAFSWISLCVLSLFTFCQHSKRHKLILEREAPNCTLPVSMGLISILFIVLNTLNWPLFITLYNWPRVYPEFMLVWHQAASPSILNESLHCCINTICSRARQPRRET